MIIAEINSIEKLMYLVYYILREYLYSSIKIEWL